MLKLKCLCFSLLLLAGLNATAQQAFTFVQVCDPQIADEVMIGRFEQIIDRINEMNPKFVVICGDHVHRSSVDTFTRYQSLAEQFKVPVYSAPGNHDFNPEEGDERATAERLKFYRQYLGADYHAEELEGKAFVFINSALFLSKSGGEVWKVEPFEGEIESEYNRQIQWIEKTLKDFHARNLPVFIVAHHPLHPSMPGLAPGVLSDAQRQWLHDLFKASGVVAVLGGHGHKVFMETFDGIEYVHGHTTSFNFEPDPAKRLDFGFEVWHVNSRGQIRHESVLLEKAE